MVSRAWAGFQLLLILPASALERYCTCEKGVQGREPSEARKVGGWGQAPRVLKAKLQP